MEFSEDIRIRAIGNLLQYYRSDLEYIRNFRCFREGRIESCDYLRKTPGGFQAFINEYRVARNVEKEKMRHLLSRVLSWVQSPHSDDVDALAESIKSMTFQKTMTSLASKILYLNNPTKIVPCDNRNRRALGLKENKYKLFASAVSQLCEEKRLSLLEWLAPVMPYLTAIESDFREEVKDLETIRVNRFIDKLLWEKGAL